MKKQYSAFGAVSHDNAVVETYLSDQSARGNHLCSARFFTVFLRGAPRRAHYRLEPRPSGETGAPSEERLAIFESFGWEYVCPYGLFEVWRSYEEAPQELHTDPQVEADLLERLTRQGRWALVSALPLLVLFGGMIFWSFFGHPQPVRYLVTSGTATNMVLLLLLELWMTGQTGAYYRTSKRLIRRLQGGEPRPHHRRVGLWTRWSGGLYLLLVVLVLAVSLSAILRINSRHEIELADYPGPLPAVSLAQVEGDPGLVPYRSEFSDQIGFDLGNNLRLESTDLAPVLLTIEEQGEVPGRTWSDGSVYRPSLTTEYYQLALPLLAGPLLDDVREDLLELYRYDAYTVQALPDAPFDEAYLYTLRETQVLAARLGGRVILVQYRGGADLSVQADAIAARLAAFTLPAI